MRVKRRRLRAVGRVQGVGYRWFVMRKAKSFGLTGWVKNLSDGRVEIVAEGEEDRLAAFLDWCRRGPPAARVRHIETEYSEATGEFDSFSIKLGRLFSW